MSSELSFDSDMDVEEGTVVGSVPMSIQETSSIRIDPNSESILSIHKDAADESLEESPKEESKADFGSMPVYETAQSTDLTSKFSNKKLPRRPFEEFLKEQQEFETRRKQKIEEKREELQKESIQDSVFQPSLCEKSMQLLSEIRSNESVFEQLYNRAKTPCLEPEIEFTFMPTINKQERKVQRSKPIFEHLYEDSQREMKVPSSPTIGKLMNKSSEIFLIERFKSEFSSIFEDLSEPRGLCYSLYIILLQRMHFIKNKLGVGFQEERRQVFQAWNSLVLSETFVEKDVLLSFLLAVMNYSDLSRTHTEYFSWFQTRYRSIHTPKVIKPEEFPFKPTLSARSIRMANSKLKERSDDFLLNERQKLQERWKRLRIEKELDETKGLDFVPKINPPKCNRRSSSMVDMWRGLNNKDRKETHRALGLYSLSMKMQALSKRRQEEARRDSIYDKMKECSFSPRVTEHLLMKKKPVVETKGVVNAITRLRQGYADRMKQKAMLDRSYTPNLEPFRFGIEKKSKFEDSFRPASTMPRSTSQPRSISRQFITPNDNYSQRSSQESIELAIKLPNGEVETVVFKEDDDKMMVIDEFIAKHGFSGDIAKHIRESVNTS